MSTHEPLDIIDFRWFARKAGYEIAYARDPSGSPLRSTAVPRGGAPSGSVAWLGHLKNVEGGVYSAHTLEPTRDAKRQTLFRDFADLSDPTGEHEPSLDAMVEFANLHGWLGLPVYASPDLLPGSKADASSVFAPRLAHRMLVDVNSEPFWGESTDAWSMEIYNLRLATAAWDLVENNERTDKRELVRLLQQVLTMHYLHLFRIGAVFQLSLDGRQPPLVDGRRRTLSLQDNRVWRKAVRMDLVELVNEKLTLHASPGVRFDFDNNQVIESMQPRNLIGFMWLQLAREMSTNQDFHRCEFCGKWMLRNAPSTPGSMRRHARYCDGACKLKANRRRNRIVEAREHDVSWSLISKRLGISVKDAKRFHDEALENRRKIAEREKKRNEAQSKR